MAKLYVLLSLFLALLVGCTAPTANQEAGPPCEKGSPRPYISKSKTFDHFVITVDIFPPSNSNHALPPESPTVLRGNGIIMKICSDGHYQLSREGTLTLITGQIACPEIPEGRDLIVSMGKVLDSELEFIADAAAIIPREMPDYDRPVDAADSEENSATSKLVLIGKWLTIWDMTVTIWPGEE